MRGEFEWDLCGNAKCVFAYARGNGDVSCALPRYPGPLFPRGEGLRRGPSPRPSARNAGGVSSPFMNTAFPDPARAGSRSALARSSPKLLNVSQNAAISRLDLPTFCPLTRAKHSAISSKPRVPSHSPQMAAAVAFNVQLEPVEGLTSNASPCNSSQMISFDLTHVAAIFFDPCRC